MWWQIAVAFWIAFQLGFFAACLMAASHRATPAFAEVSEYSGMREASFSDHF